MPALSSGILCNFAALCGGQPLRSHLSPFFAAFSASCNCSRIFALVSIDKRGSIHLFTNGLLHNPASIYKEVSVLRLRHELHDATDSGTAGSPADFKLSHYRKTHWERAGVGLRARALSAAAQEASALHKILSRTRASAPHESLWRARALPAAAQEASALHKILSRTRASAPHESLWRARALPA